MPSHGQQRDESSVTSVKIDFCVSLALYWLQLMKLFDFKLDLFVTYSSAAQEQ